MHILGENRLHVPERKSKRFILRKPVVCRYLQYIRNVKREEAERLGDLPQTLIAQQERERQEQMRREQRLVPKTGGLRNQSQGGAKLN